uniref:Uncharacterized protein MANES_06G159800 n=1 Tax=Rhizophora mucronata TaxID=61149 RepID=A0A2P2LM34_RHIMU
MEVDHTGIPYHIPDADRFPSHLRPVRWQNVMDGSGPSHLHGWDGNNGVYREEMHFYGGEWEQNRHPMNGRGWETSADIWKGNGDGKIDLPSAYLKEAAVVQTPVGDVISQRSKSESVSDGVQSKAIETKLAVASSAKEYSKSLLNTTNEKTPDTKMSGHDNVAHVFCTYLSKLDISTELVSADFYSQCMSLLNIGKSATADEDTSILVNLKDGGRAVPKNSNTLLSSLPFPAKSNAVCQRAMDIYKKQRWGLGGFHTISGGAANDSLTSNAEEQILVTDMDKVKDPALDCDEEMADVPVLNSDKKKEEAFPIATGQKAHDLLSLYSQEVHVHANSPLVKMEALGEALSHENTEKPLHTVSVDKADWMSSELLSAKEIQKDCALTSDDALQAYTSVSTDGHKKDEIEDVSPVCCDGEGQVLDDAMCGSLLFSDGSSKASEALMPGSNESESVILSRIHHSPENTH